MRKRILSMLLVLVMTAGIFSVGLAPAASADGSTDRNGYAFLDHSYDGVIAEGLRNRVRDFIDDKYGLWSNTFHRHIQYVQLTNPDITGGVSAYFSYVLDSGWVTEMIVEYVEDFGIDRGAYEARLAQIRGEVAALIPENASQLEIVHIIHDYMVATCAYDMVALENSQDTYLDFEEVGAFWEHYAVCRGLSHAYKYLLDLYGIENAIAESGACNHVWNLVKLNGEWYHIDLSYDDPSYDVLGRVGHDFFLLSTETLLEREPKRADFTVLYEDYNIVFTDDTCARDKTYEQNQPWSDSCSVCHYYNGDIYTVNKYSQLLRNGEFCYQPPEDMSWHPNGVIGAVYTNAVVASKISAIANELYMTTPKSIYRVNLDEDRPTGELFYSPESCAPWYDDFTQQTYPSQNQIFGLARIAGKLCYTVENDLPYKYNETWLEVPGADVDVYPVPDPIRFKGEYAKPVEALTLSALTGDSLTLSLVNVPASAVVTAVSDSESVAACSVNGSEISVDCLSGGTADITVSADGTVLTAHITVTEPYGEAVDVYVTEGESLTLTDESGNYQSGYTATLLDSSIAGVSVRGTTEQDTPGTAESLIRMSGFAPGQYILGTSGKYFAISESRLTTVSDPAEAAVWTVSGSASALTISSGGYYLCHSTSGVSLSTSSANGSWQYSSSGFCFTQSKKVLFWNSATTYYLNTSPSVGTGTSNTASAYTYVPATPAKPGRDITEITFTGVACGTTAVIVGNVRYNITVEEAVVPPVIQTVTVYTVDDAGKTLKAAYRISGEAGTEYSVIPSPISGYRTPSAVYGTYTDAPEASVTLTYVLTTDKSELKAELDSVIAGDGYTADSYSAYSSAVSDGRAVYSNSRALQSEVDSALAAIRSAKSGLKKQPAVAFVPDTDGLDYGSEYVLTASGKALAAVNGQLTAVSVSGDANGLTSVDESCIWTVSSSGSGAVLRNKATGQYLCGSVSGSVFSRKCSLSLSSSATVWKVTKSGSSIRFSVSSGLSTFYLSYSGGFTTAKSTGSANMTMYKKA